MYSPGEGVITRERFIKEVSAMASKLPTIKSYRSVVYYNIPAAFDIEVTSFYQNGVKKPEDKRAVMYHWQFGLCSLVTTGRTWEELQAFLFALSVVLEINEDRRLAVYVHNLSYEFQFMRKWFAWTKIFILDSRKPVYARTEGIEFRDMLKLAGGKALRSVAKDLQKYKVEKKDGDLDYSVMRSPLTPLTPVELKYCENDIRVCLHYIAEKIEQDGNVSRIPLTNTGYVRKYCRKKCYSRWKKYRSLISGLTIEPDEYEELKRGFQGGFTHANAHYVQQRIQHVGSYDLTSAYPSVMLLEKFPMSKGKRIDSSLTESQLDFYLTTHCCLFDLELFNVISKMPQDHPISSSKCFELEGEIVDNGRVVYADRLKTTVTEQDYFVYLEFYDWDEFNISNLIVYEKRYLPTVFTDAILGLYQDKTKLKGVEAEALNYMISKNMLNAAYGMTVTDPVRTEFDYVDDEFESHKADVSKAIKTYNDDIKRFLFYPWGVWVTAYTRANLFSAILACGSDYVYADTDSVKILNPEEHMEYFEAYNREIMRKIEAVCEYRNQELKIYSPCNKDGVPFTIGLWDFEGIYDEFKTLGAKRYLTKTGDKFKLTVAGTNKEKSCKYLVSTGDPFGNFDNELIIPPEATGKNLLTYIDEETEGTMIDCNGVPYHYRELSSIHMEETDYHLSLSEPFLRYLRGVRNISE